MNDKSIRKILDRTQKQLSESKKEQNRSKLELKLKSEFLSTMTHEVRTPIGGIIGIAEMLLESPLSSEQRKFVQIIKQSGNNLLAIINNILDFSKIESGKLEIEEVDFKINSIIYDAIELLKNKANLKGLTIETIIDTKIPPILYGDQTKISQVLINLLGNAIKFTNSGKITLKVKSEKQNDNQLKLFFNVIDSGIGISKSERKKLFKPYCQASCSTHRKFGGTGLGLSISKRIVEIMGGTIGVKSKPGIGSNFWFSCYLKLPQVSSILSNISLSIKPLPRIVLICSNTKISNNLKNNFIEWNLDFLICKNEFDFYTTLNLGIESNNKIDIVIIYQDSHMLDVYDVAKKVHSIKSISETQLILIGNNGNQNSTETALNSGFSIFLKKPLNIVNLHNSINFLINNMPQYMNLEVLNTEINSNSLPLKILIAEDDPVSLTIGISLIKKLGYLVKGVSNGIEAIAALTEQNDYDLVLMDCQMPEMDGFIATKIIRANEKTSENKHLPIIGLTANISKENEEFCLACGMDFYLLKPLKIKELVNIIDKISSGQLPYLCFKSPNSNISV